MRQFAERKTVKSFVIVLLLLVVSMWSAAQDTTYRNPVDGKTYVAPSGWVSYEPEVKAADSNEEVKISHVRLLQDQDEMDSRTTPKDLADFIKLTSQVAAKVFISYSKQAVLLTQFTCRPGKCEVRLASSGAPT